MVRYSTLTLVFVVTALWDVILRMLAQKKLKFLGLEKIGWIDSLEEYFDRHTFLSAALVAGFVGAAAYLVIQLRSFSNPYANLLWIAIVSAIVGIPMRNSGLFPHLKTYYYDAHPKITYFSDALSGVVVAVTIFMIRRWHRYICSYPVRR